jgi:glycosyltransferase involved in cell wall biosynthesis
VKRILFDSRSANTHRVSGWERFAKEISKRIVGNHPEFTITGNNYKTTTVVQRLKSDYFLHRDVKVGIDLIYYPTFPPIQNFKNRELTLFHLHDLTWWKYAETSSRGGRFYYKKLAQNYIRSGGYLTTGSATVRNEIQEFFDVPDSRIRIVPPGVEECDCIQNVSLYAKPYILSVGTLEPRKNLHTLVNAYLHSNIQKEIDLKIVGRIGWLKDLPDGVQILTQVDDLELHDLYANCVAVFQPSIYEGFGLPVIEAAKHGKPVVCSNIEVFREVLGNLGTFVDPHNLDEWVESFNNVEKLIWNEKLLKQLAKKFSWDQSAKILLKVYKEHLKI